MAKRKNIEGEIHEQHLFSQMNIVNYIPRRVNSSSPSFMLSGNSVSLWIAFNTIANF